MYRYETHLHTTTVSACSYFQPQQVVEKFVRLGYKGIFVTDHFLNGNTTVDRKLPYSQQIEKYCEGYEQVKELAEGKFDVFFGFEYSYWGTDFLVYGLDKAWLLKHPEIMEMTPKEFFAFARKEGGMVIQAHPFRQDFYIDHVRLYTSDVDGFEVLNISRREIENKVAKMYAEMYGMPQTAGSDIHGIGHKMLAGMEFETPLKSEKDYCERILKGEGKIFSIRDEKYADQE
ncbi:MAG: PHP domain-containing protein [Clostridiales bacterium]|nr:PHP domain-containing protein [Clostridiales bacterium]